MAFHCKLEILQTDFPVAVFKVIEYFLGFLFATKNVSHVLDLQMVFAALAKLVEYSFDVLLSPFCVSIHGRQQKFFPVDTFGFRLFEGFAKVFQLVFDLTKEFSYGKILIWIREKYSSRQARS